MVEPHSHYVFIRYCLFREELDLGMSPRHFGYRRFDSCQESFTKAVLGLRIGRSRLSRVFILFEEAKV